MAKGLIAFSIALNVFTLSGCAHNPEKEKQRYLGAGERYFDQGKYAEATIEFRKAIQLDPRYLDAYRRLGRTYVELQQWPEAAAALSLAAEIDPSDVQTRFTLAQAYLNIRDYGNAEKQAAFILEKDPNNAAALQLSAAAFIGGGQKERAFDSFQEIVRLRPDDPAAYINLAIVEIGLGRVDDAEKHLRTAQQIAPNAIPVYLNLASLYREEHRLQESEAILREAVKNNPDGPPALYLDLADTLYAEGKQQLAEGIVANLRGKNPKSSDVELAIGDLYFGRKSFDAAEDAYRRAVAIAPERVELKQRVIEVALNRGDLASAKAMNDEILKTDPANVTSHITRGRILLSQEKTADAVTELRQELAVAPNSPQAHYFLGLAYWQADDPAQAESEFRRALDLDRNLFFALHSLAELLLSRGGDAIDPANRCVSLRPSDPSERLLLGMAYLHAGEADKAREQFTIAQQLAPLDPKVPFDLALCSLEEHKMPEAKRELETALQLDPQFTGALRQLTALDVQANQRDAALDRVKKYVAAYPNAAQAHLILGSLYVAGKQYDAAKPEFERAVQIEPNLVPAYLNAGKIYQETGQTDLAIQQYQSALSLQPQFVPLITLLGNIYLEKGDLETAKKYFEQALAINPDFAIAASNLAWVYAQQGVNLDVALGLARRAKQEIPELDSVTDTLGWVQYKSGHYSAAIPLFEDCVQKAPNFPVYRYHLGMALVAGGQKEKGRGELEAALHLNLTGQDANDAHAALAHLR